MTRRQAIAWIKARHGKMFAVKFWKRSTGELREMVCRLGVKSKLRGGELPYDAKEKKLIPVYDMVKQDYRAIPVEGLVALKTGEDEWELVTD